MIRLRFSKKVHVMIIKNESLVLVLVSQQKKKKVTKTLLESVSKIKL